MFASNYKPLPLLKNKRLQTLPQRPETFGFFIFLTDIRALVNMGNGITIELEWLFVMIIAATKGNS